MFASEISLAMRNILLIQLLLVIMVPSYGVPVYLKLLHIWKKFNASMVTQSRARTNKKRNKFWEIDMTDLEP